MPQFPASIDHSDEFGISIKIGTFNLRNCRILRFMPIKSRMTMHSTFKNVIGWCSNWMR